MTGYINQDGSPTGATFAEIYDSVQERQRRNLGECVALLLAQHHVAAVHPDDGWVDRKTRTVTLTYPAFCGVEPEAGDLIALGCETTDDEIIGNFRLVRITDVHKASALLEAAGIPARTYGYYEVAPSFPLRRI